MRARPWWVVDLVTILCTCVCAVVTTDPDAAWAGAIGAAAIGVAYVARS